MRTSKRGRGPDKHRVRTAGPAMLPTIPNETGVRNGSGTAQDSDAQDDEDEESDREPEALEQQADLISFRTRHGKRPAEPLAPESDIDASEGEDSDDQERASGDDSTEGEDEPNLTKNTQAARQRRKVARVLFDADDPLQDSPTNTRTSPTNELMYLELSVTLSKTKGHVPPAWLALVANWMRLRCVSGAAALERGGRQQHLHLQIVLRIRIDPLDVDALRDELKTLVGWRRGDGSGTYCSAKTFGIGQARMHA